MKYEIVSTSKFNKDLKLARKQGLNLEKIGIVVDKLAQGEKLPSKYKDHLLSGRYKGYRDCHIDPDWVLIYKIDKKVEILELIRTGSHSDLFK
ncbi:mRNA interferase YafQ [Bacilli bacterium PM5-3]|nr:mRNA interferase YafQ [Bacilli bacterium PM5-3]